MLFQSHLLIPFKSVYIIWPFFEFEKKNRIFQEFRIFEIWIGSSVDSWQQMNTEILNYSDVAYMINTMRQLFPTCYSSILSQCLPSYGMEDTIKNKKELTVLQIFLTMTCVSDQTWISKVGQHEMQWQWVTVALKIEIHLPSCATRELMHHCRL